MRILVAVLVIGLAAAAWWGLHQPSRPQPAAAIAPPAPPALPPAPAAVASGAITFSARPAEMALPVNSSTPGNAAPVAPPAFAVVGAILFPGQQPALTLRVAGELRTVMEGAMVEGYRVERIERDRVVLLHPDSGSRVERLYADAGSTASASVVANAATGGAGPFAPPAPVAVPAPVAAASAPLPPANYAPPRAPAGATVNDNPLVGAIIPTAPGQAPPGMSGPKPVALRPGQAPPPGPIPTPVPPNAQGPVPR